MQERRQRHLNDLDDETFFFLVEKVITVVKWFLLSAEMMTLHLLHNKQKHRWEEESQRMRCRKRQNGMV